MSNKQNGGFRFAMSLVRALFVVVCFAVALVATEVFLTKGHMLAEAEIAIGCAPCGASMALATQKYIWVRN